ncbi:hypothetical protein [Myroides pelagicus]|uniref:Uncharacterized protein n=1 Tax=Myroides pelagicus TaxID=270914 RepID=A0A7K1GIM9_9FLAO|nr:hypothetical protein [Myroides pelagicus]MTH28399.1 hypothetical protein [Myroides pelagicus]
MKQVRIRIIDMDTNILVADIDSQLEFETIENQAARSSIKLSYDGSDDKYQSIMASSLVFDLLVRDGVDGKFFHLYTGAEDRYRVDLTDENDELLWRGYLLPDQYSEPYKSPTLFVSMTATDCLGILRGKEFVDYSYYSQEKSVIDVISTCLKATGLSQDILFSPAIMPTNGYAWHEIYLDCKMYADEYKKSDVEFLGSQKKDQIYDILERLIHDIGCKLYTWKGRWYIIGINQQHKELIECYKYDSSGVFIGMENLNKPVENRRFYADPDISVVSPWKTVEVSADLAEQNDLFKKGYLECEKIYSPIEAMDSWKVNPNWRFVGDASFSPVPKDGKYIAKWTHPGQVIPDFNKSSPVHIGVGGIRNEGNVVGSYMELKNPIWVQVPSVWLYKYLDFELELVAYSRLSSKDRFENNEFGYTLRYEVLLNNEVLWGNFPNSNNYLRDALELRYADDSIEWKEQVYYNKNFIETRKRLTGKIEKERYSISKSGWLQVRIYPPVLVNPMERTFEEVGIQEIKMKIIAKKDYELKLIRPDLRYSTKMNIELYHIDNAQDNTDKRFIFKREGMQEQKSWRESWKRSGVNESRRFGYCYAAMTHSIQPGVHVKVDGTALGIVSPNELLEFKWRGSKKFIPTRLEMDFSEGRTEITMCENVYEELFTTTGGILG